jgi:drug/metabolite transporter (DMT)-like permease
MQKEALRGWISLVIVYIVWGSTYLAIRIAVQPGAGFEPFTLVSIRLLFSGTLLFLVAFLSKQRIKIPRGERLGVLLPGVFLWLGGNGLVTWAEKTVASGYAALMIATTIIWVTVMEAVLDKKRLSLKITLALLIGFAGLVFLNVTSLGEHSNVDLPGMIALFFAPISWGIGTMIQKRRPTTLAPVVNSAYQQLIGGLSVFAMRMMLNEPPPTPTPAAWGALAYLIIFGSVFAFTAFIIAVKSLPMRIVMTYAYVNPLVALFLGWMILGERMTVWTFIGTILIVVSVFGIYRTKSVQVNRSTPSNADR